MLCDWLVGLPAELLGGRVVRPLQTYLTRLAEGGAAAPGGGVSGPEGRTELLAAGRVLAGLHAANEKVRVFVCEWVGMGWGGEVG